MRIQLIFVHRGPIDNRPAFVQVMAWNRAGNYIHVEMRHKTVADLVILILFARNMPRV